MLEVASSSLKLSLNTAEDIKPQDRKICHLDEQTSASSTKGRLNVYKNDLYWSQNGHYKNVCYFVTIPVIVYYSTCMLKILKKLN